MYSIISPNSTSILPLMSTIAHALQKYCSYSPHAYHSHVSHNAIPHHLCPLRMYHMCSIQIPLAFSRRDHKYPTKGDGLAPNGGGKRDTSATNGSAVVFKVDMDTAISVYLPNTRFCWCCLVTYGRIVVMSWDLSTFIPPPYQVSLGSGNPTVIGSIAVL